MLKMIVQSPDAQADVDRPVSMQDRTNYEILNGLSSAIPIPGIKHQSVLMKLTSILFRDLAQKGLGTVLGTPCRVMLSPWDVVQPDILFIRKTREGIIGREIILGPPDLAVEILSGDAWERDLKTKRKVYSDSGVPEYWIVDPETETIEPMLWSELGYISRGVFKKGMRLPLPLSSELKIPVSKVFA